jgi:hypothetical protein
MKGRKTQFFLSATQRFWLYSLNTLVCYEKETVQRSTFNGRDGNSLMTAPCKTPEVAPGTTRGHVDGELMLAVEMVVVASVAAAETRSIRIRNV